MDAIHHMHCMIIFTNEDIGKIITATDKVRIEKQAKVGNISPIDVTLKAGPTGMDSSQIELFQALKIQTKVIKNQLEVINDSKVLVKGQKINISEINIMKKFNIKPYIHVIEVKQIYLSGKLYGPEILSITQDVIKARVLQGLTNIASFSLQTGIPTKASAPHSVMRGLTNLLGLKIHTGVDVPSLKGGASSGPAQAPVEAPAKDEKKGGKDEKKDEKKGGKDEKKGAGKDAKKKEPEPEPEDNPDDDGFGGGMGDLFG